MTTITIDRALLEQALEHLDEATAYTGSPGWSPSMTQDILNFCVKLCAELAKPTHYPAWHDAPEAIALKAERDAAMKDAERYRWLRDSSDLDAVFKEMKDPGRWELPYVVLMQGADLDAAIDAAMKGTP